MPVISYGTLTFFRYEGEHFLNNFSWQVLYFGNKLKERAWRERRRVDMDRTGNLNIWGRCHKTKDG